MMKTDKDFYDLHILICTNEKNKGHSCGPKGAQSLVKNLKAWAKTADLKGKVRINSSGCMNRCESGIACVAYPMAEWKTEVTTQDEEKLKKWIKTLG